MNVNYFKSVIHADLYKERRHPLRGVVVSRDGVYHLYRIDQHRDNVYHGNLSNRTKEHC